MEKRRILYELGDSGRDEFISSIAKELKKKIDHEAFFLCGKAGRELIKEKINEKNILTLAQEGQFKIKKPDLAFLIEAEKKFSFNIWDCWEVSAQRRKKRRKMKQEEILFWFESVIKDFSTFLDKNRITDYLLYGPASFTSVIFFKMMEQKNINIIELQPSRLKGRFGIAKNLKNDWEGLKINYNRIKKEGLIKEERKEAANLLQEYYENKQKPDCSVVYDETKIKKFKRYVKASYRCIKTKHFPPSYRFLFWKYIEGFYDKINIFEKLVNGEKFVLFPLHFQPEASTLIYGKWYNNQLNLIENLVRSLPVNYKLYVKEHNFGYGNRSLRFYKEIKKYTNIRLISPYTNNLELIKKSSLIITVTGTSGWEAIMFQKPVIVFGDVFYDVFDYVKKIERIRELPTAIRDLLDKKIDYEETLVCLASLIESTYPGLARLPADCGNHSLKKENIKLLAEGITKYLKNLKHYNNNEL